MDFKAMDKEYIVNVYNRFDAVLDHGKGSLLYDVNGKEYIVQDGDILVTSGMGGHFPEGYPVAKVTRFANEEHNPFAEIKAEPLATLDRLRYVLLLWEDAKSMGPLPVISAESSLSAASSGQTTAQASEQKTEAVSAGAPTQTVTAVQNADHKVKPGKNKTDKVKRQEQRQ